MSQIRILRQREILDRRRLLAHIAERRASDSVQKARPKIIAALRQALEDGRAELDRRLKEKPGAGHESANGHAFLMDQLIRVIHDHVINNVYPVAIRSKGERLTLIAVGGYGRGEMSPHSDIDIAFITPDKATSWCEQVIEAILYYLWDLGLTVGHSSRSLGEMVRMAKGDLTIRTALLEGRYLWGDQKLYEESSARFWSDVVAGTENQFVTEKLAERDNRHKKMGDSRYVVEPNVKDGKGGLRDLQTLYWIGKYVYRVRSASELVDKGLFTQKEYRSFRRAESFLLAVRAHLHSLAKRGEDRLTFDLQRRVAERMNYADRPGKSAVERFMQFYFLQVQHVGNLTGVFLAHIEEEAGQKRRLSGMLSRIGKGKGKARTLKGYHVESGRIAAPSDDWFHEQPIRLIEIFTLAEKHQLEVHPATIRKARRDAPLIKSPLRKDARANALFLELLTGRNDPEKVLRWMNEAGVFGRFVPDFGRVQAQMQFDMYHHYTVDEHTIRAIGLLSRIESGALAEDHPIATAVMSSLVNRRAAYVAVLLHDIAKGRGGDHSVLGAEVAKKVCPRFGLDAYETSLVSWLVRKHLLMSATAFKRDLSDPQTITDFVAEVQSVERLNQLTVLTIVDIRAVGPGVWNSWKRQLLSELHELSTQRLRLGHKAYGRKERVAEKKTAVAKLLGQQESVTSAFADTLPDSYWIAESEEVIASNLTQFNAAKEKQEGLSIRAQFEADVGATLVTVIADDHPGLFFRTAGAINLAGGNIIDARIHTTRSGRALDNFLVTGPNGKALNEPQQLERLKRNIADALANKIDMVPSLAKRSLSRSRAEHFRVAPHIAFDNNASARFTVIEVNATDRPALLNRLTRAMFEQSVLINSAHITHYGERAVDTFYVTDLLGEKLTSPARQEKVKAALLEGIAACEDAAAQAA